MILLTVALCKRIAPRTQVRHQRYLLHAYLWAAFWQADEFIPYDHISVTVMRVPRPLAWELFLEKPPSRLNHTMEVTAIKSLSKFFHLFFSFMVHIQLLQCAVLPKDFRYCLCHLTSPQHLQVWSKVSAAEQENRGNLCLWSSIKNFNSFY